LLAIGFFGGLSGLPSLIQVLAFNSQGQVDLKTAQEMGIPVFTAPFQHQFSTCEMVISYLVLLARQIGDRSMEIHDGVWNKVITLSWLT
jgi:phosphoglycerate dehydrogenase-like enzyme